jgi:hypothetical protein
MSEAIEKDKQSQGDKLLAARTVRIERAVNGYVVKRADGHYVFRTFAEAMVSTEQFFLSQGGVLK